MRLDTKPTRLQPWQRNALNPFAMLLAGIQEGLDQLDHDELLVINDACKAASTTNCWCFTYKAARLIEFEVERLLKETSGD